MKHNVKLAAQELGKVLTNTNISLKIAIAGNERISRQNEASDSSDKVLEMDNGQGNSKDFAMIEDINSPEVKTSDNIIINEIETAINNENKEKIDFTETLDKESVKENISNHSEALFYENLIKEDSDSSSDTIQSNKITITNGVIEEKIHTKNITGKYNEIIPLSKEKDYSETTETEDELAEYSHLDDILENQLNNNVEPNVNLKRNESETINVEQKNSCKHNDNIIDKNVDIIEKDDHDSFSDSDDVCKDVDKNSASKDVGKTSASKDDDKRSARKDDDSSGSESEDDYDFDIMEFGLKMIMNEPVVKLERSKFFECHQCNLAFLENRDYQIHFLKHINPRISTQKIVLTPASKQLKPTHQCPDCEACFVAASTLQKHSILHQPFPNICKCSIGFYKKKDLLGHIKLVHNNNVQQWLELCDKTEDTSSQPKTASKIAKEPKTKESKSKKRKKDENINKKKSKKERSSNIIYKDEDDIKEEIESDRDSIVSNWATGKKRRKLDPKKKKAQKSSEDKNLLQMLVPEMNMTESKGFMCPFCQETIDSEQALKAHYTTHGRTPLPKDQGEVPTEQQLMQLYTSNMQNYKTPTCPVCLKTFASKGNLMIHMRVHTGERPYECDICHKRFTQGGALTIHKARHTGERKFKCTTCEKTFISKGALYLHEQIHSNKKKYVCRFCQKGFNDPSAIKRHERTHTGDKRYKCTKCPMAFTDASGLIAHRRRHEGVKNHVCNICDFRFYTNSELAKHVFLHSKRTAFECDVCGAKFALKAYLLSHMDRAHMDRKKVKCRVCKKLLHKSSVPLHMKDVHGIDVARHKRLRYP